MAVKVHFRVNSRPGDSENVTDFLKSAILMEIRLKDKNVFSAYHEFRFLDALQLLEQMKSGLLLDIFLVDHVDTLYTKIRNKFLQQYLKPFEKADLNTMAQAFGVR